MCMRALRCTAPAAQLQYCLSCRQACEMLNMHWAQHRQSRSHLASCQIPAHKPFVSAHIRLSRCLLLQECGGWHTRLLGLLCKHL